jgi:hypothetical protein
MEDNDSERRYDAAALREWCEAQIDKSRDTTARFIIDDDDHMKFRIREASGVEDIEFIREDGVDVLRFSSERGTRQFMSHRREVTTHDKTLIVRAGDGQEICRAGTGTSKRKGPFPV